MSDSHVISALTRKRAEISGHVRDQERRLAGLRANLASVDATLRLFSPDFDPAGIPPKRPHRRYRAFEHSELPGLILDALRTAAEPISAAEITASIKLAKGLGADDRVQGRVASVLCSLAKRGIVERAGYGDTLRWVLKA